MTAVLRTRKLFVATFINNLKCRRHLTSTTSPSDYCVNLVRKNDYENYVSTLLLPKSIRRTAFAIRAFNVELSQIKDVVSTKAIGDMRIQFWRDSLELIFSAKPPHQPVAIELAYSLNSTTFSKHWLRRLIDSRGSSLSDRPFDTVQDIENYSENSVSPIYYLLLEALNLKNIHADHAASHIGKAQGLTNFIRGIPYHMNKRVVLLPNDIMIKHKLSHEQVLRGLDVSDLQNVIYDIAVVAHHHVEMSRSLKKNIPDSSFIVFLPLVATDAYLASLEKVNFNPFAPKLQIRNAKIPFKLWWMKLRKSY